MTYYGRKGTRYELDTRLGSGGEGEIYTVSGKSDLVAKIYFDKKFTSTWDNSNPRGYLKEKIETMLDQPVDAYIGGVLSIAWPQDALFDWSGKFVGFTMPRVNSKHHIFAASRERERMQLYPNYTWKTSVIIAYNLALAVNEVHSSGAVVGDMNPNNIMIDEHGRVTLIDTDSFNIRNRRTGKLYKCSVGVPECLPPELQGKNLADSANQFTKESDSFALSVHIFNLLMNNCHPFACTDMNSGKSSSSNNPVASSITRGNCPYVTGGSGTPSPNAPDVAMLPSSIRSLFDRAFSYDVYTAVKSSTISKRPTALEWKTALYGLIGQQLTTCYYNSHHVYPSSYGKCPWCAIGSGGSKSSSSYTPSSSSSYSSSSSSSSSGYSSSSSSSSSSYSSSSSSGSSSTSTSFNDPNFSTVPFYNLLALAYPVGNYYWMQGPNNSMIFSAVCLHFFYLGVQYIVSKQMLSDTYYLHMPLANGVFLYVNNAMLTTYIVTYCRINGLLS